MSAAATAPAAAVVPRDVDVLERRIERLQYALGVYRRQVEAANELIVELCERLDAEATRT